MRLPFLSIQSTAPFDGLQEHAAKVQDCAIAFQQAIECHVSRNCQRFEDFRREVIRLEQEADAIKRRIRGHLPKGTLLPVDKFQLFRYLREQDSVLDALEDVMDWISFRDEPGIPDSLQKDFFLLVDAVVDPVEELAPMIAAARTYFRRFREPDRVQVKEMVRRLRHLEHEADLIEDQLKRKIFQTISDATTVFHMVRLAEIIGSIADHVENAGDMMRAMVAK
jgi:hypothetical protein